MVQHGQNLIRIPREVFLSCASAQARTKDIEQQTLALIQDSILGNVSRVEAIIAQIEPKKKSEVELMARVIMMKAVEEPQHCKSCVSLSGAIHVLLPALPCQQGGKGETFMHALLDVFQTEFEEVLNEPSAQTCSHEEEIGGTLGGRRVNPRNQNRIRAIVHFAGHLYCQRLLGNGVLSQMVQELVNNGESEAASELLWFIGEVTGNAEQQRNLGTVLEDVGDSDGTGSESMSTDLRPSRP